MFPGLELVEPGLTRCADWWPDGPEIKPLPPCNTASSERSVANPSRRPDRLFNGVQCGKGEPVAMSPNRGIGCQIVAATYTRDR